MTTPRVNTFTSFEFSERELLEAAILSPLQEQRLQSLLAEVAEQKLSLKFDIEKPLERIVEDAHLEGQIGILRTLLLASEESKIQIVKLAQSSNSSDFS